MPDRNDSLGLGSGMTCTDRQTGETSQPDGVRTGESWAGQRPTIVETALLVRHHAAGSGNIPVTSQEPNRKNHLARLADAVQKSRRLQAALVRRRYLHLVRGERQ